MKIKLILSICFSLLTGLVSSLYAQEENLSARETTELTEADSLSTVEAGARAACVNSFANQTVSTQVSVVGCSTLSVQNVTVTASGNLFFYAPGNITINGPFTVQSGGVFNIGIEKPVQTVFDFEYDVSGNRIKRH